MVQKTSESYTISRHDLLDKLGIKCKKVLAVKLVEDEYANFDDATIEIIVETEDDE